MIRPDPLIICLPNPYPDCYSDYKSTDPDISIRGSGFVIQIWRSADPNPSENLRFRSTNFGLDVLLFLKWGLISFYLENLLYAC
jgi:hypothetical protein